MLIDKKLLLRMEDIAVRSDASGGEAGAGNTELRGSATFLVVDDLELVRSEQAQLKQTVKDAVETIEELKERIESMEERMGSLYQQLDCYRALSLFVIPVVFAYIFEAMFTPEDIHVPVYGPQRLHPYGLEPKTLFMIFRGLCLCFSMCVGLPALLEEVLTSYHQRRMAARADTAQREKQVPTQTNLDSDEESSEESSAEESGSDVTNVTSDTSSGQSSAEEEQEATE